jgi:hypothetical protein
MSTASKRAMNAPQSMAGSSGIQSTSPRGPAMNPSRLVATLYQRRRMVEGDAA